MNEWVTLAAVLLPVSAGMGPLGDGRDSFPAGCFLSGWVVVPGCGPVFVRRELLLAWGMASW